MTSQRQRRERNLKKFTEDNVLRLPAKRRQYMAWDSGTALRARPGCAHLPRPAPAPIASCSITLEVPNRTACISAASARSLWPKRVSGQRPKRAREGIDPHGNDVTKSTDFKSAVEDYVRHYQIASATLCITKGPPLV